MKSGRVQKTTKKQLKFKKQVKESGLQKFSKTISKSTDSTLDPSRFSSSSIPEVFSTLKMPEETLIKSSEHFSFVLANAPSGNVDSNFMFTKDLKVYAAKLLEHESKLYKVSNGNKVGRSNSNWIKTAASVGKYIVQYYRRYPFNIII